MNPATLSTFNPGVLVRARGREWVVQPGSSETLLRLRPLGGSEEDITTLLPELEPEAVNSATFPDPDPNLRGNHTAALLLRDALQLKLRAGAGPFRSFANLAVEPRAYQLVPLLMALRLPTIRLLVADDVGIGKTIEAGLIVRELFDRGEIRSFAVLCPPHLVEQWRSELSKHFHFQAVALTASNAGKLEKGLPPGVPLFEHHPFVVVSLDYIKSDQHRAHFLSMAPECIIVDEAHTCSTGLQGRQLRFELLQNLAENKDRHMILLTATPHSGDDKAFHNLLSILKKDFVHFADADAATREKLRNDLARHFVQRRRKDIEEWQDSSVFPRRLSREITYQLTGEWGEFFDAVQKYCLQLAERTEKNNERARHVIWYATLALLRCVGSSPAAAERALSTRLVGTNEEIEALVDEERLQEDDGSDLTSNDLEPAAALDEPAQLNALIQRARKLRGQKGDPKLKRLVEHIRELLNEGFRPVVFCRYVYTAHYVAEELKAQFPDAVVEAVTGEFTPEERLERVETIANNAKPILVATDCLSEGVNLQEGFNAVVHYDLAWNPTRHEQREGRVDRFGQKSKEVRCTMLYGQDNPVDGFILNVILRKAESIRRDLGVLVTLPQNQQRINSAMVKAALLKRSQVRSNQQMELAFGAEIAEELKPFESEWVDATEKAKANRTVFAQRSLHPEEVIPEWRHQLDLIGDEKSIERFVKNACNRLNAPLEPERNSWRFTPLHLPAPLLERLAQEGLDSESHIDFRFPPNSRAQFVHRTHPLVSILADHVLEGALGNTSKIAARCAVTVTADVKVVTTIFLLRLRHQLTSQKRGVFRTMIAEESVSIALEGRVKPRWLDDASVSKLMEVRPSENLGDAVATRAIEDSLAMLHANAQLLEDLAEKRAQALLQDHCKVRDAAQDAGRYNVTPCLPVDVIGVYVLLPDSL